MNHSTMEMAGHGMGPAWLGAVYIAAVLIAIICHLFNLWRPEKLAAQWAGLKTVAHLKELHRKRDARQSQMERNMIYVCASHIPMGLAWIGVLSPAWGIGIGLCMIYGELHLAFRSYQRAKDIYSL